MIATEKKTFVPDCAFLPADKLTEDDDGEFQCDYKDAVLLMLDGSLAYTKEAWEKGGEPSYCWTYGNEFQNLDGTPIDSNEGVIQLLPEMYIAKIPQRKDWSKDVQKLTHEIYGVYAFNVRRVQYICSLTPNYEFTFIGTEYDEIDDLDDEQKEWLFDMIQRHQDGETLYYTVKDAERMIANRYEPHCFPENKKAGACKISPEVVSHKEAIDVIAEYFATHGHNI